MEHSEEYYKMKYFKYKAKYQQAKQTGGWPQILKTDKTVENEAKMLIASMYSLVGVLHGDNSKPEFMKKLREKRTTFLTVDDFIKYLKENIVVSAEAADKKKHEKALEAIYSNAKKICTPLFGNKFLGVCLDEINR
jgi:hypothetical protein